MRAWGVIARVAILWLGACVLPGQESGDAVAAAERERGEVLLRRHGEASRKVETLVADYVQRRTTALSERPLISSGTFLFRKKPACVVFRAEQPRESIVRLTAERYEVFRPRQRQLERFELDGPELAQGLFAAVGGDIDRLLKDFDVRDSKLVEGPAQPEVPAEQLLQVRLVPKQAAVQKRLSELFVTLRVADARLRAVAYRDPAGDLVEIQLSSLRVDPERPPPVEFDVPKDTKIIEHERKPAGGDGR